jgi:hypothetical protein
MKRAAVIVALASITCAVIALSALSYNQHKLIYLPRSYAESDSHAVYYRELLHRLPTVDLHYNTSQGAQLSYYVPPLLAHTVKEGVTNSVAPRIWLLFGGNAGLARDWIHLLHKYHLQPQASDIVSFLLVEYPGYGACAGSPSPITTRESVDAAIQALALHLNIINSRSRAQLCLWYVQHK